MVRIVDYKAYQNEEGEDFFVLLVQGGITVKKSKETGRTYLTKQTAKVSCTFDEETCKELIGTDIPGKIIKKEVDPYDYTNEETGELMTLTHRYQLVSEEEAIISDNTLSEEAVL